MKPNRKNQCKSAELGQYMTPRWAAERLLELRYQDLNAEDFVIEPTCGDGSFLSAIPKHVPAIGVEIDPALAERARNASGRSVLVADFRTVALPNQVSHIIGNPPFTSQIIDGVLTRSFELLRPDGIVGLIVPAYYLQTPSAVLRQASRFQMTADLLPRTLFPNLSKPLVFAQFRKTPNRIMVGFLLFEEAYDVQSMSLQARQFLEKGDETGRTWGAVIDQVLQELGGEAGLDAIYQSVAPRRPSQNPYWKEKVRQTLNRHHRRTAPGRYARGSHIESKVA